MRRIITSSVAVAALTSVAHAGGIERSTTPTAILFEDGNYVEFSYGYVAPSVSGTSIATFGSRASGDMAADYGNASLSYKTALTDTLDLAIILDQPYGVNVDYESGTGYVFAGSNATVRSTGLTAALRYDLGNQMSVYGGVRAITTSGEVEVNRTEVLGASALYTMETSSETDLGYLLGAAYEKEEIALRVSLTYASAITHDFDAAETAAGTDYATDFTTVLPQSLTLDFKSGIAADTLLFGSVRWVDWSEFDITPDNSGGALVDYDDDVYTYTMGVGRKFNDTWSGAISVSHESSGGEVVGNLGPTDGNTSLGLGATYTKDNMTLSGGLRYVWIGDATTSTIMSDFSDNSAVAVGFKVGYSF